MADGSYAYSGTIQKVTVATTGTYDITAYGAQGGGYSGVSGGAGAEVGGSFTLTAGERLEIVVGGAGAYGTGDGGGGGGGSFVLASTDGGASYHLLLAAGGGGGGYHTNGAAASFAAADAGSGAGGGSGGGPSGPNHGSTAFLSAGGGSGYNGAGYTGRGHGGSNRTGGYAGGAQASPGLGYTGAGGFGGGGGGSGFGGGGGGGYSGGAGGYYIGGGISSGRYSGGGGGGTSIDKGTPLVAQSAATENLANSGNGLVTISLVCYYRDTLIRTVRGEVPVEHLKVGDRVVTISGEAKPVRWIGRQTVSLLFSDPLRVLPIRIKVGALAENVPSRDLLVSPEHAILVDDVLFQAGALVNGVSILREQNVPERFTYYHVELDDHSLLLAENTPAETFVDNVDRLGFDNWAEHEALYPQGKPIVEMDYPRATSHRQVPRAIRERLARRAVAQWRDAAVA